jgi:hypothetical protein
VESVGLVETVRVTFWPERSLMEAALQYDVEVQKVTGYVVPRMRLGTGVGSRLAGAKS